MIVLRSKEGSDESFIYSSWLHSFRYCLVNLGIEKNEYYKSFHRVIERLLVTSEVKIATDGDDDDLIVGWVMYDKRHVYWVYVKEDFRRLGVGGILLKGQEGKRFPFGSVRVSEEGKFFDVGKRLKVRFKLEYSPWR